ncbi:MAG: hypothetical protein QOE06_3140 [Thermoleophilaceae bacterium]|nr:hypothetical protein [Thermoleophilaceae bacterium]
MAQPARPVHPPACAAAVVRGGTVTGHRRVGARRGDRGGDHPERRVRLRAGAAGAACDRGASRPAAPPRTRAAQRRARGDRGHGARARRPAAARRGRPALGRRAPDRRRRGDRHVAADRRVPARHAQRRALAPGGRAAGGRGPRVRGHAVHGWRCAGRGLRHRDAHPARADRGAVANGGRRAIAAPAPGQPGRPADRAGGHRSRRGALRCRASGGRAEPHRCGRLRHRPARGQRARGTAAHHHACAGGRRAPDGQAPGTREEAHGGGDARLDRRDLHRQDRDSDRGTYDRHIAVARRWRSPTACRRRPARSRS